MGILIKNGRIINPATGLDDTMDMYVKAGVVKALGEGLTAEKEGDRTIDAKGMWVVPGFIDTHVHLRDPGQTYKEDIKTGTASAAAGGFTTVCAMPNTVPATDSVDTIRYILSKTAAKGSVHVIPCGAITIGQQGKALTPMKAMKAAGMGAISEDGKSVLSAKVLKEAMVLAAQLKLPVLSHCEDESLAAEGCMNEGERAEALGLVGIPKDAEDIITARDILLAKSTGAHLHLCHVSTAGAVALIRQAKADGVHVTAEVCPHHFTLTEEAIDGTDTNFKMNPPLRSGEDLAAILKAMGDGTIDCVATDHAPHSQEDKSGGFQKAANGIVGLETALGLAITQLVERGILTPTALIERMSVNPAKILGLDKGNIEPGKPADITILDPKKVWTVDSNDFKSKGRNTPFDGWCLTGKVVTTIVDGKVVYEG